MKRRVDHRLSNLAQRLDRAAIIKPNLDETFAQRLAYCDTRQHNETGITSNGLAGDPTLSVIMARAAIVEQSNAVERCVVAIESWLNELDVAMRRGFGQDRPAMEVERAPECYVAGCSREVGSYRRSDGSIAYRMGGEYGGMCDMHRMSAIREAS